MADEEILIADDEAAVRMAIRKALQREGMRVTEAGDGAEALELLWRRKFALVILDVMMPDVSGYDVIQSMRGRENHTPVMMLSGKSDEVDQALGLGFSADYYLTKPFHVTVLIQAAKALIRRSRVYNQSEPQKLHLGPFSVDTLKMECLKNGRPLNFTGRELALFRFLMENPGQVFTKEQLYSHVWHESIVDDNTVTVYVKRIRAKIEDDPRNPRFLKTVRGVGYKLEADT